MKGDLQMLPVLLLFLAVGAAALVYYFWTRRTSSREQSVRNRSDSAIHESTVTVSDESSAEPLSTEARPEGHLPSTPCVSHDNTEARANEAEGHKGVAALRARPGKTDSNGPEEADKQPIFTAAPLEEQVQLLPPTTQQVAEEREATRDDTGSREGQPVLGASEGSGETSNDRPTQSAETAPTEVSEETDRPAEEHPSKGAVGPGQEVTPRELVAEVGGTSVSATEQSPSPRAKDEVEEPVLEPVPNNALTQTDGQARNKAPRQYSGLSRALPKLRNSAPRRRSAGQEEPARRERALAIEVRLRFLRGGSCSVSLIAKRSLGLPEDLTVVVGGGEVNLRAMQDEWYQDVVPDDLSGVLKNGTVWGKECAKGQYTWSLSGREIYVLAGRPDISGYVSRPSLALGRDHIVLCTEPLRSRVEEAIKKTGAQPSSVLDGAFGAPPGWVVFRSVVPHDPISSADRVDIFNALRPLPRIEISIERGIRLGYSNWLDGHPPSIRVYGDPQHAAEVRIDGEIAERLTDGSYRASGWDTIGSHSVWCAGTSRSYSIVPFEASWELWDAYGFSVDAGGSRRLAVCGPNVRSATDEYWGRESFSVPEKNPVLLGPKPGQIVRALRASRLRGLPRIASPGFRPIWALPRDPLHCDKTTTRILCLAGSQAPETKKQRDGLPRWGRDAGVTRWCKFILDASRKGMAADPDTEAVRALWLSYKQLARRIWGSRR